jgi:hypothetical protein
MRDARIGGVARSEKVVDAGPDDVVGAQPRDVDEPARRVRESQRSIGGPHRPRQLAEHQAQRAVAFPPIGDGVLQRAIQARVVDGEPDGAGERLDGDQVLLRVRPPRRQRRQRDDADHPIARHQRRQHRRTKPERLHRVAVALTHRAGAEGVFAGVHDEQRVARPQRAAARLR